MSALAIVALSTATYALLAAPVVLLADPDRPPLSWRPLIENRVCDRLLVEIVRARTADLSPALERPAP